MDNTTLIAILTCSGMWAVINTITAYLISKKQKDEDKKTITKAEYDVLLKAIRGLLYGELERRCTELIQAGEVSVDDLTEIRKYYYEPYIEIGGDGVIAKLFADVEKLPIKKGGRNHEAE